LYPPGKGTDIDPCLGQDARDIRKPAGLVLEKYRYLFDFHKTLKK
jgi:hypothetical protein